MRFSLRQILLLAIGELLIDADPAPSAPWRKVTTKVQPVSGRAVVLFTFATDTPALPACDLLSFRLKNTKIRANLAPTP